MKTFIQTESPGVKCMIIGGHCSQCFGELFQLKTFEDDSSCTFSQLKKYKCFYDLEDLCNNSIISLLPRVSTLVWECSVNVYAEM